MDVRACVNMTMVGYGQGRTQLQKQTLWHSVAESLRWLPQRLRNKRYGIAWWGRRGVYRAIIATITSRNLLMRTTLFVTRGPLVRLFTS